jgi:dTDP-glucose 4,6-dehydratase
VTNLIEGKKIPLYGDGLNIRDWLHVDDHCRGIDLVVNLGEIGQIYNIGGGTELSNVELTAIILESMKINDEMIEWVQDRLGHDRRYSVDWTKIRTELGYVPELSLHSSIHQLIDWYRTNESWWQPLKERARVN